jgi:hypothetical protein
VPERFGGHVSAGKLLLDDPVRWASTLARHAGKRLLVTLESERLQRTTQQNRWYWAMVVPLVAGYLSKGREVPLSNDQAHYVLKSAFIGVVETPLGPAPKSSRKLSIEEFSLYCDKIVSHAAAEWGMNIPAPGERIEASL